MVVGDSLPGNCVDTPGRQGPTRPLLGGTINFCRRYIAADEVFLVRFGYKALDLDPFDFQGFHDFPPCSLK